MDISDHIAKELQFVTELVELQGMVDDPGYYSGSGASPSYLSGTQLAQMYRVVLDRKGMVAAAAYETMVCALPMLSPSDFLTTLRKLAVMEWKWDQRIVSRDRSKCITNSGAEVRELVDVLTSRQPMDDTEMIRKDFLQQIQRYKL